MLTKRAEFEFGQNEQDNQSNQSGRVVTLNTEDKQVLCMLQAFYSRSPNPVEFHLEKVEKLGPDNFMAKWYIGYGHDSIGDSATDTLFIEGIADNEAEDLQNHPLARLQRASTRMMDFSKVAFILPASAKPEHRAYVESLRKFYLEAGPILEQYLLQKNQIDLEKLSKAEQTSTLASVKAAKFDILRGFLPAGVATNMSLTLSLRNYKDHLNALQNFPNPRIQEIAKTVRKALHEKHPSSFPDRQTSEQGEWLTSFYEAANRSLFDTKFTNRVSTILVVDAKDGSKNIHCLKEPDFSEMTKSMKELLKTRPKWVLVPKEFNKYGVFRFDFLIDHGSARDLKRHNAIFKEYDRLSVKHGFEDWYLNQLPEELQERAKKLIKIPQDLFDDLSDFDIEYFVPMGYRVNFQITAGLADLIYLLEIRCGDKVHPTLREPMRQIAQHFQQQYPDIALYADISPSSFNFERGNQTIREKA